MRGECAEIRALFFIPAISLSDFDEVLSGPRKYFFRPFNISFAFSAYHGEGKRARLPKPRALIVDLSQCNDAASGAVHRRRPTSSKGVPK
jgi:hypothetical protein